MLLFKCSFVILLTISSIVSTNVVKKDQSVVPPPLVAEKGSNKISLLAQPNATDVTNSSALTAVHNGREGVPNLIFTEGGNLKISPENKIDSSPKPFLQPLEGGEVSKSSIQPRKGADINIPISNSKDAPVPVDIPKQSNQTVITTPLNITTGNPIVKTNATYKIEEPVSQETPTKNITLSTPSTKKPPRKPTLTMPYDEAHPNSSIVLDLKNSSSQKLISSKAKETSNNSNAPKGQPGFVVPLVITMIAIPMLAFIGYQGVKKGKEAWKNRHYRRMDFLIDGMYND